MAAVNDILNTIDQLPSLPSSGTRIISMLMDDELDLQEVGRIVRNDEAIAMTVLRYANSAQFGRPGRTFDLEQSILRLGRLMLMKIALEQQTSALFVNAGSAYGLRRGAMWRGAIGGALAAEEIALAEKYPEPELCFLCGLFRDVGKLVLDAYVDGSLDDADESLEEDASFLQAERAMFGADHAEIGEALAARWGLPERIQKAIRYHHDPPASGPDYDRLYCIVHAADVVCLWAGLAIGHDGLHYQLAPHVREELFVSRGTAEQYMTATWDRLSMLETEMNNSSDRGMSA